MENFLKSYQNSQHAEKLLNVVKEKGVNGVIYSWKIEKDTFDKKSRTKIVSEKDFKFVYPGDLFVKDEDKKYSEKNIYEYCIKISNNIPSTLRKTYKSPKLLYVLNYVLSNYPEETKLFLKDEKYTKFKKFKYTLFYNLFIYLKRFSRGCQKDDFLITLITMDSLLKYDNLRLHKYLNNYGKYNSLYYLYKFIKIYKHGQKFILEENMVNVFMSIISSLINKHMTDYEGNKMNQSQLLSFLLGKNDIKRLEILERNPPIVNVRMTNEKKMVLIKWVVDEFMVNEYNRIIFPENVDIDNLNQTNDYLYNNY